MPDRLVLCVDDEPVILLALRHRLRRELGTGWRCETAESAESGLEIIDELGGTEEGGPTVVVSDWLMPGMRGDEFLRLVRARLPGARLILLTGFADRAMVEALRGEVGLAAVFHKPCEMGRLVAEVRGD